MKKKLISLITPCFNEFDNIDELCGRIRKVMESLLYDYEHIFIDNNSNDGTIEKIRKIISKDKKIKMIVNSRNYGHLTSPYYGIMQTTGNATICLASDLQDPPELIIKFLTAWEKGNDLVLAIKVNEKLTIMSILRKNYYRLLSKISSNEIYKDATGFGLYDKSIVKKLIQSGESYPYLRGHLVSLASKIYKVEYSPEERKSGKSKNTIFSLYDLGIHGLITNSIYPIRIASYFGIIVGLISIGLSVGILVTKLLFWDLIPLGYSPLGIIIFAMFGLMFIFVGLIGEYLGLIHKEMSNKPIVIERERVNFD